MLKYFKVNPERNRLIPDLKCYQVDLRDLVEQVVRLGLWEEKYLPSWAKVSEDPTRAKGFLTRMLQGIFYGQNNLDKLNVEYQTGTVPEAVLMFFNAKNKNLKKIGNIVKQVCGKDYKVITLCGASKYNGKKVTNKNAESIVRNTIKENKRVIVIASSMAQRSFSVPEITHTFLAYDGGSVDTAQQKGSRSCTPDGLGKTGYVISLSFDPNRDDKLDGFFTKAILDIHARNSGKMTVQEVAKKVLRSIDIFSCEVEGAVKYDFDKFFEGLLARKDSIYRASIDLSLLNNDEISAIASGNKFTPDKLPVTPKGETWEKTEKVDKNKEPPATKSINEINPDELKAKQVILGVCKNLDFLIGGAEKKTLDEAMLVYETNESLRESLERVFDVSFSLIKSMFKRGIIRGEMLKLIHERA